MGTDITGRTSLGIPKEEKGEGAPKPNTAGICIYGELPLLREERSWGRTSRNQTNFSAVK